MAKKKPRAAAAAQPPPAPPQPPAPANPARCTVAVAAELLTKEGLGAVTAAQVQADVDAGVPLNADGTVNLVIYCAWLLKRRA